MGSDKRVFVLFCGKKDADGNSWCSDCVKAWPVISKVVNAHAQPTDVFIYVDVGNRDTWKNPANEFRTRPDFKLTGVPTMVEWQSPKKLVEEQLQDESMVEMLLAED
eukprot:m.12994 g.12994  ORF g.12994 m.12994 type:complete len:107 (-) comp10074_c0_seq1:204-524(-)